MYQLHPSLTLQAVFKEKPYQGCCPIRAQYLFIGLDANYAENIEQQFIFPQLLEYHQDGVAFWKKYNLHHPFLDTRYKGDGKRYHREFAKIGLDRQSADKISFIELLHVPTVGRNSLTIADLDCNHLRFIQQAIASVEKKAVFISDRVFRLMQKTNVFTGLHDAHTGLHPVLSVYKQGNPVIYKHLHFSNYGKFQAQKEQEAQAIRALVQS